jgi:hypothetical protein
MATREERDEQPFHDGILPDNHSGNPLPDRLNKTALESLHAKGDQQPGEVMCKLAQAISGNAPGKPIHQMG